MNKKGIVGDECHSTLLFIIIKLFLAMAMLGILLFFISNFPPISNEVKQYDAYSKFCENKTDFCYCEWYSCSFKTLTSQSCMNGNCSEFIFSEDTKELCILAKELNDKEILFETGCK